MIGWAVGGGACCGGTVVVLARDVANCSTACGGREAFCVSDGVFVTDEPSVSSSELLWSIPLSAASSSFI